MYVSIRQFLFLSFVAISLFTGAASAKESKVAKNEIADPFYIPYVRPIGFTFNAAGLLSGTFEGRFHLGLFPNISLVVAPSYQITPNLPLFNLKTKDVEPYQFKRLHLAAGLRGHFYKYDSLDGWFIEGMAKGGKLWVNEEDSVWSVMSPVVTFGYEMVHDSGYTTSIGLGFEYEFLLMDEQAVPKDVARVKDLYWGITKIPVIAEISMGWTW